MTAYTYGLRNRPLGFGSQPDGWVSHDEKGDDTFRWGTVTYSKKLSKVDIDRYEMIDDTEGHIASTTQRVLCEIRDHKWHGPVEEIEDLVVELIPYQKWSEKIHPRHIAGIVEAVTRYFENIEDPVRAKVYCGTCQADIECMWPIVNGRIYCPYCKTTNVFADVV